MFRKYRQDISNYILLFFFFFYKFCPSWVLLGIEKVKVFKTFPTLFIYLFWSIVFPQSQHYNVSLSYYLLTGGDLSPQKRLYIKGTRIIRRLNHTILSICHHLSLCHVKITPGWTLYKVIPKNDVLFPIFFCLV